MDLGARVKAARLHLGLAQRELAEKVGKNITTVQGWEAGRTAPNGIVLSLLVEMGIDGNWLLGLDCNMLRPLEDGTVLAVPTPAVAVSKSRRKSLARYKELAPFVEEALNGLLDSGLGDAYIFGRKGTQSVKWRILQTLHGQDEPMEVLEIQKRIKERLGKSENLADIRTAAEVLVQSNHLVRKGDGYLFHSEGPIPIGALEDRMELVHAYIEGALDIVPRILESDGLTRTGIFRLRTENGLEFLDGFGAHIKAFFDRHSTKEGDEMFLYISAEQFS